MKLVCLKNHEYNNNAVDVCNEEGSLGLLDAAIGDIIAPHLDSGNIIYTATVFRVIPHSRLPKNFKNAIVGVEIRCEQMG